MSDESKPVNQQSATTGLTGHDTSHDVSNPDLQGTRTKGTIGHGSSHDGAPNRHLALREGTLLMLFLTMIFGLIGWTVQNFGQLAGERAAERAVDARMKDLDERRKKLRDEIDEHYRIRGVVHARSKDLADQLEEKSSQLAKAAEELARVQRLLEENFSEIAQELATDAQFRNAVVNTMDERIPELADTIKRHREELLDFIQTRVGFGEWITIAHQKGDPGGVRKGVAATDGWLMMRGNGLSAVHLRISINGKFTSAQAGRFGCILSPVSKGDTWVCEGRVQGNPNSSNEMSPRSVVVKWLPIGVGPAEAIAGTD